jgi:hypothetical protein
VVIYTWVKNQTHSRKTYPMAHSFAIQQYSKMWYLLWLKPNVVLFWSMQKNISEMGHKQDTTELKTDNTTADGIINYIFQRSKAIGMKLYWVKDKLEQDQFNVGWAPGDTSMGDYFTNHHSPAHPKCMIP